jgi:hypothetical protein
LGVGIADYRQVRLALVLILPALFAGHAATASNTVPASLAGSGAGPVSGYTVSAVSYSLAGETIDRVSFTLSRAGATMVQARLAPGAPWAACTVAGSTVACPLSVAVSDATSLEIVATGS